VDRVPGIVRRLRKAVARLPLTLRDGHQIPARWLPPGDPGALCAWPPLALTAQVGQFDSRDNVVRP